MKRLFLTLALVFGLVATAAAQINIGGRLGATMSTFRGDDADDAPWGVGFNAGVAAKYGVNQMISVAPELGIAFLTAPAGQPVPAGERALSRAALARAVDLLREAKALHDELEAVYRPYMDFETLTAYTQSYIEELFRS